MSKIDNSLNNNTNCNIIVADNGNNYTDEEKKALLENYYQNIVDDFTTTSILGNDRSMSLNDIYVEPLYKILLSQTTQKEEYYSSRFTSISNDSIHTFLNHYFVQDSFPDDLKLKNANIILLLGQPGQGKTSFSKKTMFDYIKNNVDTSPNYFMIRLRDIGQVDKLLDDPIEVIGSKLQRTLSFIPNFQEDTILLLDGLDELAMKEQLVTDTIDNFLETLIAVTKDYPKLKILLTSRTLYVNIDKLSKKLKGDILTLHLQEFSLEKQIEWIDKYKIFYPKAIMSQEILKQLHDDENQHILELIEQPILLHMITELNMTHEELTQNTNRAKIYKRMFDSIINRKWESGKEHENLKGLTPDNIRELLQTIAFEIYKSDYEYIHRSKLEKLATIKEFYRNLDIDLEDTEKLDGILKGVLISFYFQEVKKEEDDDIEDSGNYAIEFMHKSLQEYLVAEKIFEELLRFIDKDRKKKYFIVDYIDALKNIWELFSHQQISPEIKNYLIDIIKNQESDDIKKELGQRLASFLPELLKKDFLYSYNLNEDINPMQKSLDVFYGYWTVLSNLGLEDNYIAEEFKEQFARYLLLIRTSVFELSGFGGYAWSEDKLILSNQKLDNVWLVGIDLGGADLHEINLEGSVLDRTHMGGCNITNANLSRCSLSNITMVDSDLSNTDLSGAFLRNAFLKNVDFTNAILDGADLTSTNLEDAIFKNTRLQNINIDDENAKYLQEQGISFTLREKKEWDI